MGIQFDKVKKKRYNKGKYTLKGGKSQCVRGKELLNT